MTDNVAAIQETLPAPTIELLRLLWQEDVDDATWEQWGETADTEIEPEDYGHSGVLVFHRKADDSYWAVPYRCQSDFHTFRDDDPKSSLMFRVWPTQVVTTEYLRKDPRA